MLIFKQELFKRQNVRTKQCRNRESRESKEGRKGGERIWFCLSVLIQYPRCTNFPYACVRSNTLSHRAVRCSFFMVCLRGRPTFLLNQSVSHKARICNPERCTCSFGQKSQLCKQKSVSKANHYILVPNNAYQNQCFCVKKTQTSWT